MFSSFAKLNERLALIKFPVTLAAMNEIKMDFSENERIFYEVTIEELNKHFNPIDLIYSFEPVQPTIVKHGFMVMMEKEIVLTLHNFRLSTSATLERIPIEMVEKVDSEIVISPLDEPTDFRLGVIYITYNEGLNKKKCIIRNVNTENLAYLVTKCEMLLLQ
ncbi:hypothetical protein [Exiguobacterium sp. s138]|uniref:hypothetical protein n=1 Tax=Exiguobacterium sp. s138 TaxID=2751202 RepID=UPI001BECF67F|nr:hypothetical protein [Exiguobacterium sp. s138]